MRKHQSKKIKFANMPRRGKGAPTGHLNTLDSGIYVAERALRDVAIHGSRSRVLQELMNGDVPWSNALREFRQDLITSLGGADKLNVEANELLNIILVDKIVNDSLASYLLAHPTINRQKKRVFEVVMQRSKLAWDYVERLKLLRQAVALQTKDVTPISQRLKDLEHEAS